MLLEGGGSLLVIEHNLGVIKYADWVIDIGPKAALAAANPSRASTLNTQVVASPQPPSRVVS